MALKVKNYEHGENIYPDAYVKIAKIITSIDDVETFVDQPDGSKILVYEKLPTTIAQVYAYADEVARKNNAIPFHHFAIEVPYDCQANPAENIYSESYYALANLERFKNLTLENI